ncbi:MAG TPA: hypothetical protein VG870_15625 [Chitinophagaceae bacterium]|nr:hypothetical protein [Chitinophagaceae bacterium]
MPGILRYLVERLIRFSLPGALLLLAANLLAQPGSQLTLTISPRGYASLLMVSPERQDIRFNGYLAGRP